MLKDKVELQLILDKDKKINTFGLPEGNEVTSTIFGDILDLLDNEYDSLVKNGEFEKIIKFKIWKFDWLDKATKLKYNNLEYKIIKIKRPKSMPKFMLITGEEI